MDLNNPKCSHIHRDPQTKFGRRPRKHCKHGKHGCLKEGMHKYCTICSSLNGDGMLFMWLNSGYNAGLYMLITRYLGRDCTTLNMNIQACVSPNEKKFRELNWKWFYWPSMSHNYRDSKYSICCWQNVMPKKLLLKLDAFVTIEASKSVGTWDFSHLLKIVGTAVIYPITIGTPLCKTYHLTHQTKICIFVQCFAWERTPIFGNTQALKRRILKIELSLPFIVFQYGIQ